ncbi:MAG: hypothetical protein K6B52_01585 [Clostridiales bacterium]|nr:hypothetical protein [Clostridiales bacterium]
MNSENLLWLFIMIPVAALFSGIGIFAWKRKKPMWFNAGKEVSEDEISDIPAYNRANGIMWLSFSAVIWLSVVLGIFNVSFAGTVLALGILGGIPCLAITYGKIYNRYHK